MSNFSLILLSYRFTTSSLHHLFSPLHLSLPKIQFIPQLPPDIAESIFPTPQQASTHAQCARRLDPAFHPVQNHNRHFFEKRIDFALIFEA